MFFHDKHSSSDWRPGGFQSKPPMQQNTLLRKEITIERKEFVITLSENLRGRFVRIVERTGNRSASIVIPSTGLKDFQQILADMVKASQEIVTKTGT